MRDGVYGRERACPAARRHFTCSMQNLRSIHPLSIPSHGVLSTVVYVQSISNDQGLVRLLYDLENARHFDLTKRRVGRGLTGHAFAL